MPQHSREQAAGGNFFCLQYLTRAQRTQGSTGNRPYRDAYGAADVASCGKVVTHALSTRKQQVIRARAAAQPRLNGIQRRLAQPETRRERLGQLPPGKGGAEETHPLARPPGSQQRVGKTRARVQLWAEVWQEPVFSQRRAGRRADDRKAAAAQPTQVKAVLRQQPEKGPDPVCARQHYPAALIQILRQLSRQRNYTGARRGKYPRTLGFKERA